MKVRSAAASRPSIDRNTTVSATCKAATRNVDAWCSCWPVVGGATHPTATVRRHPPFSMVLCGLRTWVEGIAGLRARQSQLSRLVLSQRQTTVERLPTEPLVSGSRCAHANEDVDRQRGARLGQPMTHSIATTTALSTCRTMVALLVAFRYAHMESLVAGRHPTRLFVAFRPCCFTSLLFEAERMLSSCCITLKAPKKI